MSLFKELRRRNVFKVALAYGITAWLIAQMAGLAADSFIAPEWVMKMLITILLLGFPVALVMAWAYEMTPDGLRRETDAEDGERTSRANGKLDRTIVVALIAALAYIAYDNLVIDPQREAALLESAGQPSANITPEPRNSDAPKQEIEVATDNSIAVLPFVNMSDDSANEYFSDGLSEELLNLLVKIPELQVAARTSSFSFKGKDIKVPQIARELGVIYVLEGSVRKAGNHVRITVQLIKADDGFHLWSETYDRTLDDIFVTQDEIAEAVVSALKVKLMGAVPQPRPTNPEVYSLYLQGMYFNNLKDKENLEKAQAALEQALAIDPDFAPAWVSLSVVYQDQRKFGWRSSEQAFDLSMAAIEKALEIDPRMAMAWASLAYLKRGQWDWQGAEVAIKNALTFEPNNAFVVGTAASLAGSFGQVERSIELFQRVTRLNPLSQSGFRALAVRYAVIGQFDEALDTLYRVAALNSEYPGVYASIGMVHLLKGDPETALLEIGKNPNYTYSGFLKARALSTLGNEAEAQAIINKLLKSKAHEQPGAMGATYAWRGENDLAFKWFEIAYQQRDSNLAFFLRNRWNKKVECDPRYLVLVEKLGLLEYWKTMPKPEIEAQPCNSMI